MDSIIRGRTVGVFRRADTYESRDLTRMGAAVHRAKRGLVGALLCCAAFAPVSAHAQTQRISVRGAAGLMQSFGGELGNFDPGTLWEIEARMRPVQALSVGGGQRAINRQYAGDNIRVSGWFIEPRLHSGPVAGGLFSAYLSVRGTFGKQRLDRNGLASSPSTQFEVGPGVSFPLGSRVALDLGILLGWEDPGDIPYATPKDMGSGYGATIRAGLAVGIY